MEIFRLDSANKMQEIISKMQYTMAKEFLSELYLSGINYAIIKGCPLSVYKTGNPGMRVSSDIDILIHRKDVKKLTDLLKRRGFYPCFMSNRIEHVLLISSSHQISPYYKSIGRFNVQVDINFDLFWGEYRGERVDLVDFLDNPIEMEIYGCKIKTLSPIKTMIQLILHHYKEMNSLYHLTGHDAINKRLFEDIYVLCKRYEKEISVDSLYELGDKYKIIPYMYYIFFYTQKVFRDDMLDEYLSALYTREGEELLNYYGLEAEERKLWHISFENRLDTNVADIVLKEMSEKSKMKLEKNRGVFG